MKKVHPEFQGTWIDCACGDKAHSICVETILEEDDEMEPAEFVISMRLRYADGFFRRLINAIKYLVGKPCRYGEFDTFITSSEEKLLKIREKIDAVIETNKKKGWEIPTHNKI